MKNWKLALTTLLASSGTNSLFARAQACNPKPNAARDIKFSDIGGEAIHNFEFRGNARIVEPAPGDIPRALRIDQLFSYALLKDIDISPSKMPDVTMAIGVYIESIRPAISNAPNPDQNEAYGWVMSHDNGGYDRAIFLHDERFGGVGMSAGKKIPVLDPPFYFPLQEWVQVVAVWRQGGECNLYIQNEKIDFAEPIIGSNNDGLPAVAIGAPQLRKYAKENDNDFWIKDIKIFDYALSDQEVEDLNCNFVETLEPTLDCGQGGAPVFSCTECVSGDGSASGCGGDCIWKPEIPHCDEKDTSSDSIADEVVDCGDHSAADCSQCGVSDDGLSGCAGECKFDESSQTCVDEDYAPTCDPYSQVCVGEDFAPPCKGEWINVALAANGGVASQSSTYATSNAASRAIDGNTNGTNAAKSINHTKVEKNPWWKVQFERNNISSVKIYNRETDHAYRIKDFIMEMFDGDTLVYSSKVSAPGESSTDKRVYVFDIPQIAADTVKVRLAKTECLHMAEVEVFAVCHLPTRPYEGEFVNVALSANGGRAIQSSDYATFNAASRAIDGNTDGTNAAKSITHTKTEKNPWWKVLFLRNTISSVKIYNRDNEYGYRTKGFIMEMFDGSEVVYSSEVSAPKESSTTKNVYEFDIPEIAADMVRVRLAKTECLHMAEVQVFAGSYEAVCNTFNVALAANGGKASQSSTYATFNAASRAIDGNTDGTNAAKSINHTKCDKNEWWKVEFKRATVSSVKIYNRDNEYGYRIKGFIMEMFDGYGKLVYSSKVSAPEESSTTKRVYEFDIPQIAADRVRVRLAKTGCLHMAEVEVIGEVCE